MWEMFPEQSCGADAAVAEDRAMGWASRQSLQLMPLEEVWFGSVTLAGSAGFTPGPVRKEILKKSCSWILQERRKHLGYT